MAGLLHNLDYAVEIHAVAPVGECGIQVGIEGAGGGIGVAFYARNLDEAAHGVAGKPQVVFQPHLGGIFYLRRGASEKLRGSSGGHGACHPYLTLAPYFGAADRGVVFDHVAKQPGCGQGAQNPFFGEPFEVCR